MYSCCLVGAFRNGYLTITVLICSFLFTRIYTLTLGGAGGARRIFERLLLGIMYRPMVFFETTPLGEYDY